jgi:leucyl/phenylalanyl-tRNA---protein transferase
MTAIAGNAREGEARSQAVATDEPFRETPASRLRRITLGLAYAVKPRRLPGLPPVGLLAAQHLMGLEAARPTRGRRLGPDGLAGISNDLSVAAVMKAYRAGLYPFSHVGPVKWWASPERMVVAPRDLHLGKNLRRTLRRTDLAVTFDRDFASVIRACAEPRAGHWQLTWITPRIMRAFARLHEAGHAHSFEVWSPDGDLVGGGYGLAVGRVFFTESQFSRVRDASKVGFASLNRHLAEWGFMLNDGKDATPYLAEIGFRPMPRDAFEALLDEHGDVALRPGAWTADVPLRDVAEGHV